VSGKQGEMSKEIEVVDVDEWDRRLCIEGKGKKRTSSSVQISEDIYAGRSGERAWIWKEKAMYRDINMGFHFCE